MSLFEQWKNLTEMPRTEEENKKFWKDYFLKEKSVYESILGEKASHIFGVVSKLAEKYGMDVVDFIGFIDGINTSLEVEVDLSSLSEDTEISMELVYEKLYYNMLVAKADWLYNLEQWDQILSDVEKKEIKKKYARDHMASSNNIGRNDPCPCGSGKKYKKCCLE